MSVASEAHPPSATSWRGAVFSALVGGLVWSCVALFRGAPLLEWAASVMAATLTVWMAVVSARVLMPLLLRPIAPLVACMLPLLAVMAYVLITRTHHRPLGAVTFSVAALASGLVVIFLVSRRVPRTLGLILVAVSCAMTVLPLVLDLEQSGRWLIEASVGVGALSVGMLLERRVPKSARAVAPWILGGIVVSNLLILPTGTHAKMVERQPIGSGLIGLFR